MANNIIAYIGCDSFYIILYLSRILHKLNHRVLLIDYSKEKALSYCFPKMEGLDLISGTISYRGVDFTTGFLEEELKNEYDDILINCGMNSPNLNPSFLSKLIVTTDLLPSNITNIANLSFLKEYQGDVALLMKDAVESKITSQYIITTLNKDISENSISILYQDEKDNERSILCQVNQIFNFYHISVYLKNYLLKETQLLSPQTTRRQLRKAYLCARKGE